MNSPYGTPPGMTQAPAIGRVVHIRTARGIQTDIGDIDITIPAMIVAVWGDGMINATGFKADGSITTFSSIHPTGHPRAGSITWHWPEYVAPVTLQSLGFE
jgi:hypothetical protein